MRLITPKRAYRFKGEMVGNVRYKPGKWHLSTDHTGERLDSVCRRGTYMPEHAEWKDIADMDKNDALCTICFRAFEIDYSDSEPLSKTVTIRLDHKYTPMYMLCTIYDSTALLEYFAADGVAESRLLLPTEMAQKEIYDMLAKDWHRIRF